MIYLVFRPFQICTGVWGASGWGLREGSKGAIRLLYQ
jgi:hypothetical protein